MTTEFLDTAEDVQWLKDTHLKGIEHPDFLSFILRGNEDCPTAVELYSQKSPNWDTVPVAAFVADDEGNLKRV